MEPPYSTIKLDDSDVSSAKEIAETPTISAVTSSSQKDLHISDSESDLDEPLFYSSSIRKPAPTASLFIANLDPSLSDESLFDVLQKVVEESSISSVRICRAADGSSLGYGYVNLYNTTDATELMQSLNYTKLNGGKVCRISKALAKLPTEGNVFVRNLPLDVTERELWLALSPHAEVISVKVLPGTGKAYVQFETQQMADKCKELNIEIEGQALMFENYIKRSVKTASMHTESNTEIEEPTSGAFVAADPPTTPVIPESEVKPTQLPPPTKPRSHILQNSTNMRDEANVIVIENIPSDVTLYHLIKEYTFMSPGSVQMIGNDRIQCRDVGTCEHIIANLNGRQIEGSIIVAFYAREIVKTPPEKLIVHHIPRPFFIGYEGSEKRILLGEYCFAEKTTNNNVFAMVAKNPRKLKSKSSMSKYKKKKSVNEKPHVRSKDEFPGTEKKKYYSHHQQKVWV